MRLEIHHYHHFDEMVARQFRLIFATLEKIMSALDDLKLAIAELTTELNDNNAEIEVLLANILSSTGGTSDADVQSAVADIRALIASNKAEVDKAKTAVTP